MENCNSFWWREVCKRLKQAVVLMDFPMAENLHWNGGLGQFLRAGVKTVRLMDTQSSAPPAGLPSDCKKAAFMFSTMVDEAETTKAVQSVLARSAVEYCILITLANHQTHVTKGNNWEILPGPTRGQPIFEQMESLCLEWMGNMNFTVELFSTPLFLSFPMSDIFLTIPFQEMHPPLTDDLFHPNFHRFPDSLKARIEIFVSCWNNVLQSLNIKEDCFCVGPLSSAVASRLAELPAAKSRRKTAETRWNLIFVDRTADFWEVLKCPTSPIMERIFWSFAKFPGHQSDRAIPLDAFPPGTLFHNLSEDTVAAELFEYAFENNFQDTLAKSVENLESILRGKFEFGNFATSEERLDAMMEFALKKEDVNMEHSAFLEICGAIWQLSKNEQKKKEYAKWARLVKRVRQAQFSLEKLQRLADADKLSMEEELLCLTVMYSAQPSARLKESQESVNLHMERLAVRILEESERLPEYLSRDHPETTARSIFDKLANVAKLREVLDLGKDGNYLKDLVGNLLDPQSSDSGDLVCKTGGLGEVLKSGFGLLGSAVGRRRVVDSEGVVVCVLGGVSPAEICAVRRQIRAGNSKTKIIFGGTQLISSKDLLENVFGR